MTQSSPVSKLNIVVVGAGLGGIAAAISCALAGHSVTVLESAKELAEIGAGLQITPNGSRLLKQWQLPQSLWDAAAIPTVITVHRYSGPVLAREEKFDKNILAKYGSPVADLHRVDLQRALYQRAIELGVTFHLGERVLSLETSKPRPVVCTQSGHQFSGDLVVAADGLWSKCREEFLHAKTSPLPTGDLAYRIVLTLDDIKSEKLREWVKNPEVHIWIGPGAHAVGYSLRAGQMYNIVLLVPDTLPQGVAKDEGNIEEMQALFNDWDPILTSFLKEVKSVEKWKLMHRQEMDHWVSEQSNLVFLGDACHPMLPYLAQGANSALEDGAVLGALLGEIKSKAQLPYALERYESLRKSRGEAIVRETFLQRRDFHLPNGPEQEKRDQIFLSQLGKEIKGAFPSRWTCPEVQPWIYGYDATKEVEESCANEPFPPA
ncbi:hypothetical protein BZA70DRAFT_285789 [Myxozyma melibiosi]|uniref:FAD-binding domain-containing protein n=1 Tax=Myxozyma melibiosi TaxID=54550 RepID=A0ABR1EY72_9ASCO